MHCGLWLEGIFLQRMSRRLRPGMPRAEHEYLLHELREEAGPSLMSLRVIEAGGLVLPDGSWHAPRAASALGRFAPAGGGLFWLAMLIGEDVPDKFNRYVRSQAYGINPAVRQVCTLHVVDEARHISLARRKLETALAGMGAPRRGLLSAAARRLLWQLSRTFYFPPARFYELAGLTRGVKHLVAAGHVDVEHLQLAHAPAQHHEGKMDEGVLPVEHRLRLRIADVEPHGVEFGMQETRRVEISTPVTRVIPGWAHRSGSSAWAKHELEPVTRTFKGLGIYLLGSRETEGAMSRSFLDPHCRILAPGKGRHHLAGEELERDDQWKCIEQWLPG